MKSKLLLTGLMAAVLTACGGGGGDSAPAAAAPTTKISGTAAVGAAIANATVQAKCASGSGTATTAADGTFTINIANLQRPCVLSVSAPDGTVLHSVIEAGTGTAVVANITPLTELITAALAKGDTNAFFAQFDANAQARLTAANLTDANGTVRQLLLGLFDLTGVDAIKGTLVAANGANAGNALDKLLDQLGAGLTKAKTSLADLSSAVGNNAGAAAIQTILQPASDSCAGLRTGKYWAISQGSLSLSSFDAATSALTLLDAQGNATNIQLPFTPFSGQACRFSTNANSTVNDVMVSKSGIALVRNVSNPGGSLLLPGLLIPAQKISLAELAGTWNAVGYERDNASEVFAPTRLTFTLAADGKFTAGADCTGVSSCTPWQPADLPTLAATSSGAFTLTDTSGTEAVAVFKGTDGLYTAVIARANGIVIASKQVARPLPVVGSTNSYWDATFMPNLSVVMDIASTTIQSVDAATGTYTRKRASDGRLDAWTQNSPTPGLRYRGKSSDTTAREGISLVLGNTGVGVLISLDPASLFFDISVNRPQ